MIRIQRNNHEIMISGHAHYAEYGKDIVCSAVSALTQTLIASIEQMTEDKIEYEAAPGMMEIRYGTLSEESQLLVKSFFCGCELIATAYSNHVRVE